MKQISATAAQSRFGEMLEQTVTHRERIVVTRRGKPVAALVPIEDMDHEAAHEAAEDELDIKAANKARRDSKRSGEPAIELRALAKKLNVKLPAASRNLK